MQWNDDFLDRPTQGGSGAVVVSDNTVAELASRIAAARLDERVACFSTETLIDAWEVCITFAIASAQKNRARLLVIDTQRTLRTLNPEIIRDVLSLATDAGLAALLVSHSSDTALALNVPFPADILVDVEELLS